MHLRTLLTILAAALVLAPAAHAAKPAALPPVGHVFVVVLENEDEANAFGPSSPAPYLAHTLTAAGAFVPGYYGIGHNSLDDYLAMVSGQAPTTATQADCPLFVDLLPGAPSGDGQVVGQGCVYPASVQTLAGQLAARGSTWKGYMEDMGNDPVRDNGTACAHPMIGSPDRTQQASPTDQYATRHNPFVYFHSIIDDAASCAAHVVGLTGLSRDLVSARTTPNLSFITPDLCHDGHDATCADGGPGGLPAADAFLRQWVPRITGSPAFRRDGLLAILFDEAGSDSSACCGEQPGPNTPAPGGQSGGPGGGRTGAVLLSPFIRPGTTTAQQYNHYSLLRSIEDLFGLPHLGYAGAAGLRPFGSDVYTRG
ncbi:MAG: phosphatidylinositol-3-phosphatase [Solirubrobacteraceae bacterium]|nr:phosphatidylinositol-3-phosphatase [Solirubrobacteraceae bacterium]